MQVLSVFVAVFLARLLSEICMEVYREWRAVKRARFVTSQVSKMVDDYNTLVTGRRDVGN